MTTKAKRKKLNCYLCDRLLVEGTISYDQARWCEIGLICPICFPLYLKIQEALKAYYDEKLKEMLGGVKL